MTIEEWVSAYGQAWEARDPAAATALFTEDATYRSLSTRIRTAATKVWPSTGGR